MSFIIKIILTLFLVILLLPFRFNIYHIYDWFLLHKKSKVIYLTFDDGPDKNYTPVILDMLKELQIKATFFVIGNNALQYPDLVKRTYSEGHLIGNHTLTHPHFIGYTNPWKIQKEILETNKIIAHITGQAPIYFRSPYGESSFYSDMIIKIIGLKPVLWTVALHDWKEDYSAQKVTDGFKKIKTSEIVLLHDWTYKTSELQQALKSALIDLRERGFEFRVLE